MSMAVLHGGSLWVLGFSAAISSAGQRVSVSADSRCQKACAVAYRATAHLFASHKKW